MFDDEGETNRPVVFGWLRDLSRSAREFAPDAIYEKLLHEVFEAPDPTRSHVITLHLYVEYWLNRIVKLRGISARTFHDKVKRLHGAGALEPGLAKNLDSINKLRNIYAHELDLAAANERVFALIKKLELDPYFHSTDPDPLRTVCMQTMFLLEATFHNGGKPPKLPEFPRAEAKRRLEGDGELHWQSCELLSLKQVGYVEKYTLRCPMCGAGTIVRERDATPGFKDATMSQCQTCGLTGDGYRLFLRTAEAYKEHTAQPEELPGITSLSTSAHLKAVEAAARQAAAEAEQSLPAAEARTRFLSVWRAALNRAAEVSHSLGDVADPHIVAIADAASAHLRPASFDDATEAEDGAD
jgi:hypothetical protein